MNEDYIMSELMDIILHRRSIGVLKQGRLKKMRCRKF